MYSILKHFLLFFFYMLIKYFRSESLDFFENVSGDSHYLYDC